jgi:lipoate-protein ligase A
VKDKHIRDVQERVTSLNALLGRVVSYGEAEAALAEGFCRALSLECIEDQDGIVPEEARALELAAGKFAAPAWLHKSPIRFDKISDRSVLE